MFKICRTRIAICCSIILTVLLCLPSIGITGSNSLNVLTEIFINAIKTSTIKDTFEIKYCPDNTCEVFQIKGGRNEVLADFTMLYLYYASGYIYLVLQDNEGMTALDRIRPNAEMLKNKYMGKCSGEDLETASCILTGLVKRCGIRGMFIRYDEGQKNIGKWDMIKEVALEQLEKTRDWREKQYSK